MPEPMTQQEFAHEVSDGLQRLELIRLTPLDPEASPELHALYADQQAMVGEVKHKLATHATDARLVLSGAIETLGMVEDARYVVENLTEGLKKGGRARELLTRTYDLGLSKVTLPKAVDRGKDAQEDPPNGGRWLKWMRKQLARVADTLIHLAINALRAIPDFVAVKPSLGIVTGFPMLSVQFELEANPLTIREIFDLLRKGLWDSP